MVGSQHVDKTSAEDKSVGFDYQYYFFLRELLSIKPDQVLGLEVMDDVHCELSNDTQILVQLKHTVQKQSDGTAKNLTTMDSDLWKTLSNWSQVIADVDSGRKHEADQLDFVARTTFLLSTNKSENGKNKLINLVKKFQNQEVNHDELVSKISEFCEGTKNDTLREYINATQILNKNVSREFFLKIRFDLGCDDLIAECKSEIEARFIDPSRIDEVFQSLDSQLRSDNYELVRRKEKIIITYEDFVTKYRIHFDRARNSGLKIRKFDQLPEDVGGQLFIQQLVDIGDIDADDLAEIATLSTHHLLAVNNLEIWAQEGDVTKLDIEALEDDAVTHWRNRFRETYRKNIEEQKVSEAAQGIIDDLRKEKLSIFDQPLSISFSNGEFYDLCENKRIGWRQDWETKYK